MRWCPGRGQINKIQPVSRNRRVYASFFAALLLLPVCGLLAQGPPPLAKPGKYTGRNISGELVRDSSVNMSELASAPTTQASSAGPEIHPHRQDAISPPIHDSGPV